MSTIYLSTWADFFSLAPEGSQSKGLVTEQHPKADRIQQMLTNTAA